jgi:hypothetical protein
VLDELYHANSLPTQSAFTAIMPLPNAMLCGRKM